MAFCYCRFISCVMQDFWWYFTLWPQHTRNSAVGELKYFRGHWHMQQVTGLSSVGHNLQFFGTWNPVKTIIIRIYEHLSEDTTSVGLQFIEGNTGSLELISSWGQENERSDWLELPIARSRWRERFLFWDWSRALHESPEVMASPCRSHTQGTAEWELN